MQPGIDFEILIDVVMNNLTANLWYELSEDIRRYLTPYLPCKKNYNRHEWCDVYGLYMESKCVFCKVKFYKNS